MFYFILPYSQIKLVMKKLVFHARNDGKIISFPSYLAAEKKDRITI